MRYYEEKEIKKVEKTLSRVTCDQCDKEISKQIFYIVTTGHHDWGNDSIDSIDNKDICSNECLQKEIDEYMSNNESFTNYINIEKSRKF
jgi:hypothetical protein